ncbi:MAG: SdrD B-like domain-containing protein [Pirellulaceae bacterium]
MKKRNKGSITRRLHREQLEDRKLLTMVPPGLNAGDTYMLAFVTSQTTTPDFGQTIGGGNGIVGGDLFVNGLANAAGTVTAPGSYSAIISDSVQGVDAVTRIPSGVPIYNTNGDPVAADVSGLFAGFATNLRSPIVYDEYGSTTPAEVWTGTDVDGLRSALGDHGGWLSNSGIAAIGTSNSTTYEWVEASLASSSALPLYGISSVYQVCESANGGSPGFAAPEGTCKGAAVISGIKFDDINGDGIQQAWEPGLPGWTIFVDVDGNERLSPGDRTATSAADGSYTITDVPVGATFNVFEVPKPGWQQTTNGGLPVKIELEPGAVLTGIDFGNFEEIDITGTKFSDTNRNGVWDEGENGLEGWTIYLDLNNNGEHDADEPWTKTEPDGTYAFRGLGPSATGEYTVRELIPSGPPNWKASLGAGGHVVKAYSGIDPSSGSCSGAKPIFDDPEFANLNGQISAVTCFNVATSGDVLALFHIDDVDRNLHKATNAWLAEPNGSPSLGQDAAAVGPYVRTYHRLEWSRDKLGDVFGVTYDDLGNIYVTATSVYGFANQLRTHELPPVFGPAGSGAVYKIDRRTGVPSVFAQLPNQVSSNPVETPSLGNITFDATTESFFVSNFEDGSIYRLDRAGQVVGSFDHGAADTTPLGQAAPLGELVWGVATHQGRLYYAVWSENHRNVPTPHICDSVGRNSIYSVDISGAGFGTSRHELDILPGFVPSTPASSCSGSTFHTNPVSDISFSPGGKMLLAERTMDTSPVNGTNPAINSGAHASRLLEFELTGGTWSQTNRFDVGPGVSQSLTYRNSAGGADYDHYSDGLVWVTGDALRNGAPTNPQSIYGLQGLPQSGGNIANSYFIDLDGVLTTLDKSEQGDVEIPCRPGVNFGNYLTNSIHGQKWEDFNDNGIRDPDELGLNGWTIEISDPNNPGTVIASQVTHDHDLNGDGRIDPRTESGLYWFDDLPDIPVPDEPFQSQFIVREIVKPGWHQTSGPSDPILVDLGFPVSGIDFGNNRDTGSIHGFKFIDTNGDGVYDPNKDMPMPHIKFSIVGDSDGDGVEDVTIVHTDENGEFWALDLIPGQTYKVTEELGAYFPSTPASVDIELFEYDVEIVAFPGQAMLRPDQFEHVDPRLNFGNAPPSSIHGFKYEDVDGDGKYNPDVDKPWADVWFALTGDSDGDGVDDLLSGTTDKNGELWFTGLRAGTYTLSEVVPDGAQPTTPASVDVTVEVGEEKVAFEGQAMLVPGQYETVVADELMFGNQRVSGSIHGQKILRTTRNWRNETGTGGVRDDFATGNLEPSSPSSNLQLLVNNSGLAVKGYDDAARDRNFIDSITGLPSNIVSASLRIGLKPAIGSVNDGINLGIVDAAGAYLPGSFGTRIGFDPASGTSGFLPNAWDAANYPNGLALTIPIPASVIALMESYQQLDVRVQDDTAVDFIQLCVQYDHDAPLNGVPIELVDMKGNVVDTQTTMSMNGVNGLYWFEGVIPGTYSVREVLSPPNNGPFPPMAPQYSPETPTDGRHFVSLRNNERIEDLNFINRDTFRVWEPCFIETGPILPVTGFSELADEFQTTFVDQLGPDASVLTFDDLPVGAIDRDALFAELGVRFDSDPPAGRSLEGIYLEGDPTSIEPLDGYDGTYGEDGSHVYAAYPNNVAPLRIEFAEPVTGVGSFIATGIHGDIETLTIQLFDENGNLISELSAGVSLWNDPSNREGFWGFTSETPVVSSVTILNDNQTATGRALVLDDLYWTTNRSEPECLVGDFDCDEEINMEDLNLLHPAIVGGSNNLAFDVDGDGTVSASDGVFFIRSIMNSHIGDANLDREFNSGDFVAVFAAGLYETGQPAKWDQGDFNFDGVFDSGDFVAAFADGGYELGPRATTAILNPSLKARDKVFAGIELDRWNSKKAKRAFAALGNEVNGIK